MPQNTKAITEYAQATRDTVALVLKWILLFTALICFVVLVWGTYKTYQLAPPLPQQFQTQSGRAVMTEEDIVAGKAGFQRADLMDYGSLYGMGSYFGEDYTAKYLLRLGRLVEEKIAQARYGKSFADLAEEEQYLARKTMQRELQSTDLSAPICVLSTSVSDSIVQLKQEIASTLLNHDAKKGWTKAYSLDEQSAVQTAEFLIYSSLTTIAHRPGQNSSYTNNWPYEPSMGNSPTPATFYWTWVSFCFVFLGFGAILYIYHHYLSVPDDSPRTPLFMSFKPLTSSQRKVGQYFLVVAVILLIQIGVGALMAHYYVEREGFYGIAINDYLPFNFLRDVHIQTPIVWIALSWISAAVFMAPIISKKEAKGQGFLVSYCQIWCMAKILSSHLSVRLFNNLYPILKFNVINNEC